jgi:hypothetical protein
LISALTIAAVTAVIKSRIENWLVQHNAAASVGADISVAALPPDRIATGSDERPQLNLFFYSVTPNTAIHRSDTPAASRRGPGSALSFDLHYLVSAYGAADLHIEVLLGYAIHALQQAPVLERAAIRATLDALASTEGGHLLPLPYAFLNQSGLAEQLGRMTIIPQFLSFEEQSRIWSALQARYRPSVAYRVSAVTIEQEVYAS